MPKQSIFVKKEKESDVEKPCTEFAEQCGWIARKSMWISHNGCPDHFYARRGRIMLVEYKAPGKPLRADQEVEIAALRAAGVEVHVIDNLEDGYELFARP